MLVVVGHSEIEIISKYIYWFHMPLFFVLSGFFFRSIDNINEIKLFIKKRAFRLLIPYFLYLLVIFLFFQLPILLINEVSLPNIFTNFLIILFIGGRATGDYLEYIGFLLVC